MPTPNPTSRREYKGAAAASTLASSMSNSDGSFTLTAANNWPTGSVGQFIVTVSRGQSDEEKILCSVQASKVVTVTTRGFDGTSAQAHASGSTVECTISAFDADEWNQHTNATGAVHGVAGNVVGDTDTQTLTNKTLTSPTISTPTISTPTISTPTVSGVVSMTGGDTTVIGSGGTTQRVRFTADGTQSYVQTDQKIIWAPINSGVWQVQVDSRGVSGNTPLIVRGASGQSVPIFAVQTNGGGALASIDQLGNISATNLTSAWTAYTPTFTNCTSPVGTFRYLLMGKTLFIRASFSSGTVTATGAIAFTLPAGVTSASGIQNLAGSNGTAALVWQAGNGTNPTSASLTAGTSLVNISGAGVIEVA